MTKYKDMKKAEAKEHFGYCFKRSVHPGYDEAYAVQVNQEQWGSGTGVYPDNPYPYDINEVKQYLIDCPEMDCKGWYDPYNEQELRLIEIRTKLVDELPENVRKSLYEKQLWQFKGDDFWEGDSPLPLIALDGVAITCDRASELIAQYAGDDDEKANEIKALRNSAKEYIRTHIATFFEEHGGKPEMPVFERRIVD